MALSTPLKALALVTFLLLIGGATYGVKLTMPDAVASNLVGVQPAREVLNATPGHTITYAVTVSNRDAAAKDLAVEVAGEGYKGRSEPQTVAAGGSATYLVPVELPAALAPGDHALAMRVLEGDKVLREREGLSVRVLAPAPGYEIGDAAQVVYVGRLADTGRVFNTNDPALIPLSFPKTDTYRPSSGLLGVDPQPRLVEGFVEGLVGMQAGETRTITFGPEKGYGPASQEQTLPREDVLDRTFVLNATEETVARDVFDGYVAETKQGAGSDFQAGEVFLFEEAPNKWPYRITSINETEVRYIIAVEAGQRYTLFPFWPEGSVVENVTDAAVTFLTTPTTADNETFTMKAYWPEMSAVGAVNDTSITVRHTPPVGFTYTQSGGGLQPNAQRTVKSVGETGIVVTTPSQNPLAGKDLTFDVTIVRLDKQP